MKRARLWGGLAVIGVLIAGAVAFVVIRDQRRAEAEIVGLVEDARVELARPQLDHNAAAAVLRRLRAHPAAQVDARIQRARARLQLALGRLQDAWDAIDVLALGPSPTPEDLLLGAKIAFGLHALRGDTRDLDRALSLAREHAEATGAVESLFMAWQCAVRGGREEQLAELGALLRERHGDTPQGKLAAMWGTEAATEDALRGLANEFTEPPVELRFLIALRAIERPDADLEEVAAMLEDILLAFPASVDARHLAAVVHHQRGDRGRRDGFLDWLLANAPENDQRRATWKQLRQVPAASR